MNLGVRIFRYAQARFTLEDLNQRTAALADAAPLLIRETFSFCNGFLQPIQVEEEIQHLVAEVRALRPRRVLEIGTSMGGTLYLWTRVAAPDATLVSVDLPGGRYGGGYSPLRTPIYQRFAAKQQRLHLLRGNSHSPEVRDKVVTLFQNQPVDFLFLDGDHSYEGVKQDWETYGQLVRPGGIIAFHDIAMNYDDTQVKRLWDEIKPLHVHREYAVHPRGFYGIGVVTKQ